MRDTYDYIVVGGGSAGCVLAARLSENPKTQVLLIEAGRKDDAFWGPIPLGITFLLDNPKYAWLDQTNPSQEIAGRSFVMTRGKMLGGSSSLNGNMYVRGDRGDYDDWAAMGCTGWAWDDVLPFFRKGQHMPEGDAAFHGRGGPLKTSVHRDIHLSTKSFIQAAQEIGIPANDDTNSGTQEGIGLSQATIWKGRRSSTAQTYLKEARGRKNLDVLTNASVSKILIQDGQATGVLAGEQVYMAQREIVVSSGAIGSPQILMRSGIGDAAYLQSIGVTPQHNLKGVGENLQDQLFAHVKYRLSDPKASMNSFLANPLKMLGALIRWHINGKGVMGFPASDLAGFFKSEEALTRPDVQIAMLPFYFDINEKGKVVIPRDPGLTISAINSRPFSRGRVRITSPDPSEGGSIDMGYLRDERDLEVLGKGVRKMREIMRQPIMTRFGLTELKPGSDVQSDAEMTTFLRQQVETIYHPSGSCRMGTGSDAVVDPRLRVHGIKGLRVADASIMPRIISGNTNAPTIMIGEKAAHMMLEDAV